MNTFEDNEGVAGRDEGVIERVEGVAAGGTGTSAGDAGAAFEDLTNRLPGIREAMREQGLDGWLLYDLHLRNPVTARLTGRGELTRRYFVLLPVQGEPCVLMHGIEEGPWDGWPWARRSYVGWRELREALGQLVGGLRVAMEISPEDAVPALDLVPAGVAGLVRAAGADVVSSGELVTRFHSRWNDADLASHRRAAEAVAEVAREVFDYAAEVVCGGREPTEGELGAQVLDRLTGRGFGTDADCIVANGVNAADPHYEVHGRGAPVARDDVLLLDLWGRESGDAVFADQTWMAYLGSRVPDRVREVWGAVRDARDAAVDLLRERSEAGGTAAGYEVDDATRRVIADRGFGDAFIHRTGHSIEIGRAHV